MDDDTAIDWHDQAEVAARMVEQFGLSLAQLIAEYDAECRYDDLIADFRAGRVSLALKRDGLRVLEDAPVPPPTIN
jgi:hypothetical protein